MTTYAYGSKPGTFASIREEAKEPWRGLTASLNNRPYLVVGKDGDKFILEGEDGDIQNLESFQWTQATEGSRLVSASRHPETAFTKGSVFGQFKVGNLAYEDGEWFVRNGDSDEVLPLDWMVDRAEALRNDPGKLAWEIRQAAAARYGLSYDADYKCPMCGSHEIGFDKFADDAHCQDCGHVGQTDEFIDEPPDYDGNRGEWYPDFRGPEASVKEADYHYIREEDGKWCIWQKGTGKTLSCHASKEQAEAAFRAMETNMHGGSVKLAATFSMPMPPEGIHFRTHAAMQQAGISGTVQYPPLPGTEYEQGLTGQFPGGSAIDEMDYTNEVEDAGMNPQDITLQVTVPDGQEQQAEEIINQLGGAHRAAKVALEEQDNGPGETDIESEVRAVVCPKCGSHTLRSFGVQKGQAELKCLTCGNEFTHKAMPNPEAKTAADAHKFLPGQRVQLTHPNYKGERGSVVNYSGKHADLGEEQYEIQLDSGDKITNIPESAFNKIKSAKVDNSDLTDTTGAFFLDSMTYIADSYPDGKGLNMNTIPLTDFDDNDTDKDYDPKAQDDRFDEPDEDPNVCPMCGGGEGSHMGDMGTRSYFRCRNCGMDWSKPRDDQNWDYGNDPDNLFGQDKPGQSPTSHVARLDSKGNALEAGRVYLMSGKNYTVPDLVRILNLEHDRIEAAIASDQKGAFPIIIESSDESDYKFEPVEHSEGEKKEASGWKFSRSNWSSKEQRELIDENLEGRARNYDKLDLSGTHYETKSSSDDLDFLWGL